MSGHSHWASIKHKKAVVDAKRGKLFSKLAKNIISAARSGGNPDDNLKLRYAIDKAKAAGVARDSIERAIKKGTGESGEAAIEEVRYEGYGPHGVAVMIDALTDNRNRTAPEMRKMFERAGGALGATNCVAWMFVQRGVIHIPTAGVDEDKLMEAAMDAGAEDMQPSGESFEITTQPHDFDSVREKLKGAGYTPEAAEVTWIPQNYVTLEGKHAKTVMNLLEMLDDHDDVQNVYTNADFAAEVEGTE